MSNESLKLNQLPVGSDLGGAELLYGVQGGKDVQFTTEQVKEFLDPFYTRINAANVLLDGLSTGNTTDVVAGDSGLVAIGKFQAKFTQLATSAGSSLIGFIQTGTGAVLRTEQAKLRDTPISVKDFGATGDGVTDDLAACQAARDSIASGQAVHLVFPRGAYNLSADLSSNGRLLSVTMEDGASLTGVGIIYVDRVEQVTGAQRKINIQGNNEAYEANVLGTATYLASNGVGGGYGDLFSYESYRSAVPAAAGDIAVHHRARWYSSTGTGLWARWTVAVSPPTLASEKTWGMVCEEMNPVDQGVDRGWAAFPGADTWSGGLMVVPDVWAPAGSLGGNVLFSFAVFQSTAINVRGPGTVPVGPAPYHPRSYNGYLIGLNGIAPDGRGAYFDGSDSASSADYPNAPLQIASKWKHGLRTDTATLSDGLALLMGATQVIAWVDGSALATNGFYSGTGSPESATTAGIGSLYLRRDGGAGTTAYFKQTGTGNTGWVALGTMGAQAASAVAITGGTIAGLTGFAIRNAGTGAFDMTQAHNGTLTAGRTLTWNLNDAARAVSLSGDLTVSSSATISNTNTGDQTITLTSDVTGSGTGSFATTIAAGAVTLAKMANMATASVFYRKTAGSGAPEVQTLATLKTDLGLTGTNSGDQTITLTGNVTGSGTGSFATTIAASAVTLAMQANLAASSIIGNNTGSPATPIALTTSQVKTLLAIANTDVSGLGTMSTQAAGAVAITGGTINGTTIGASSATTGKFSTVETTGAVGIGGAVPTTTTLDIQKTITGATISRAVWQRGTVQSDVTVLGIGFENSLATQASAFTVGDYRHFFAQQGTIGASSAVSSQTGFYADSTLSGAAANFGFLGALAAASGSWNFYASGTANNAYAGLSRFGGVSVPVNTVDITGSFGLGAPVTKSADFTLAATENHIINNKSGSTCVATLPAASSWTGRWLLIKTIQAQLVNSASSNVVPLVGGSAAAPILAATAGKWALLFSDGTNWQIMAGN